MGTMTWTPLRAGETADCVGGCGRVIAGTKTAKELGVVEHHSHGLCPMCAQRQRKLRSCADWTMELTRPLGRGWREQAACRGADPALFEERTHTGPIKRVPQEILATALRFCQGCPVRSECKAEADSIPALTGLFGGVYRTLNMRGKAVRAYRRFDLLNPTYLEGI